MGLIIILPYKGCCEALGTETVKYSKPSMSCYLLIYFWSIVIIFYYHYFFYSLRILYMISSVALVTFIVVICSDWELLKDIDTVSLTLCMSFIHCSKMFL